MDSLRIARRFGCADYVESGTRHLCGQEKRGIEGMQTDMDELNNYLNDHLAGSVAALELLERLIDVS
jgi:hypothetical protein